MGLIREFHHAHGGDEFYTRYSDIARELGNYDLSGMVVYCNCDNPETSQFLRHFRDNFAALGLKGLMATFMSSSPFLYEFDGRNEKRTPIRSGRFQDNMGFLDRADVVVTNPPYSEGAALSLIEALIQRGKKFIVVGPLHLIQKKRVIDYVNSGQLSVGYNSIYRFDGPEGFGTRKSLSVWWTNMETRKSPISLTRHYEEGVYRRYDNYDAINVDAIRDIPCDYDGNMGVPISFIGKYSPSQFELIGVLTHPRVDGKDIMSRLIVRNKNSRTARTEIRKRDIERLVSEISGRILPKTVKLENHYEIH